MLTIRRIVHADELKRYGELEGEYHYMGETHSGGDTMRLVIEEDGVWVALMTYGGLIEAALLLGETVKVNHRARPARWRRMRLLLGCRCARIYGA